MEYAIFENGGKQYKAVPGATVEIDRMPVEEGASVEFDRVLLISTDGEVLVGTPTVAGARVKGTVEEHFKAKKVLVFKYIPRKRYRRTRGHRQQYTRVRIDEIVKK
ncbi:MAG: 50S ribosomal protein L21 [Anaerolineae bacterium]|nr:MAG: 50S ribosomal protein L21 [Anaerolineae bacterium]